MAGDDVDKKKPDPSIYRVAAERLKLDPKECLVIEDSTVGLKVFLQSHSHLSFEAARIWCRDVCPSYTYLQLCGRWAE